MIEFNDFLIIYRTRVAGRELTALQTYMEWPTTKQLESTYDAEGPLYYAVLALLLQPSSKYVIHLYILNSESVNSQT